MEWSMSSPAPPGDQRHQEPHRQERQRPGEERIQQPLAGHGVHHSTPRWVTGGANVKVAPRGERASHSGLTAPPALVNCIILISTPPSDGRTNTAVRAR